MNKRKIILKIYSMYLQVIKFVEINNLFIHTFILFFY